ncbi:iron-containing redox enzyme family protein [Nocardia nova]|uniref:iron-containing redox enzyme family protein n=1 Tax=Nocardia nova TaxID=37330 RepID=UPI0033DAB9D3
MTDVETADEKIRSAQAIIDALDAPDISPDSAVEEIHQGLFARLDHSIGALWEEANRSRLWRHLLEEDIDISLYGAVMTQIYHYARHNSINQAVAAFRATPEDTDLLRYAYKHAREELGHEKFAVHDLRAIGVLGPDEQITESPVIANQALVRYLYGVALCDGPIPRLGYSYWAESVEPHMRPLLQRLRETLGLTDNEMTFFEAHGDIDVRHFEDVKRAITRAVRTPEQADAVHGVAVTTLWLTISLLDQTYDRWLARNSER